MEVGGLEHQASSYSKLAPWRHDSTCLGKWYFLISEGLRAQTNRLIGRKVRPIEHRLIKCVHRACRVTRQSLVISSPYLAPVVSIVMTSATTNDIVVCVSWWCHYVRVEIYQSLKGEMMKKN